MHLLKIKSQIYSVVGKTTEENMFNDYYCYYCIVIITLETTWKDKTGNGITT